MIEARVPAEYGDFPIPQGRATPAEVDEQANLCLGDPVVQTVLEAVGSQAVVLNAQRQIVAANRTMLQVLPLEDPETCQGMRLGEAIGCIHALEGPSGCGSSRACRGCGALLSVLNAQETCQTTTGECLISTQNKGRWESREYAVRAVPLNVANHRMTLLGLQDISSRKRRQALERVFIHDLQDALHGMRSWMTVLHAAGADPAVIAERVLNLSSQLSASVDSQARLIQAETGDLVPEICTVSPEYILDKLMAALPADLAPRLLRLPQALDSSLIRTDPEILCRILRKMVLNALEALPRGGHAQIWHERRSGCMAFVVQNPGCMPPEVADQVFQRSFSTKAGPGRGMGTYGMKLLGETVLGGKVGFTTNWADGTRFFIELPGDV